MFYELWHVPSANVVGTFDTKDEALSLIRDVLEQHGADAAQEYLLGQEDKAGRSRLIAEGKALVALVSVKKKAKRARTS